MYLKSISFILFPETAKQILFLHFKIAWEVIESILSQIRLM